MTREEVVDDLKVGIIAKIYTESGETFEGEIIDFGPTSLKISSINEGKIKRISYSKIEEYETGIVNDSGKKEEKTLKDSTAKVTDNIKPLSEYTQAEIEAIRQEWREKINPAYKQDYNRIKNVLDYAKKIKEYNINSDRVKRALAECKELAIKDTAFFALIAIIYLDLKEYLNAEKYYQLAVINNDNSNVATNNEQAQNKEKERSEMQEQKRKGVIYYYNREKKFGFIKEKDGKSEDRYFYIEQVKDIDLQKMLASGLSNRYNIEVSFGYGINYKDTIAADAIELDEVLTNKNATTIIQHTHEGVISDYNLEAHVGEIQSDDKFYKFVDREIKDTLLAAVINSGYKDYYKLKVKFNLKDYKKEYKNKRRNTTEKVACDILGLKIYSESEIESFVKNGLITQQEADKLKINEDNTFVPVPYVPLPKYHMEDLEKEANQSVKPTERKIAIEAKPQIVQPQTLVITTMQEADTSTGYYSLTSENEKRAISLIVPENSVNEFSKLQPSNIGKKFYQEAHDYMVGTKNNTGVIVNVDLAKAEELFIKAIQADDRIESAVADLASLYVRLGDERSIIRGLQLLEEFGYLFTNEKLMNMRLQLIEKSENKEAIELFYLDAIPKCSKAPKKWHYMTKLAGFYYKWQAWEKAATWFEKRIEVLDKNKDEFPQYEKVRNTNLRYLLISNYCCGKKELAKVQAREYLSNKPQEQDVGIIEAILEGSFELSMLQGFTPELPELMPEEESSFEEEDNYGFSQYLNYKLNNADVSRIFSKLKNTNIINIDEKIKKGVFTGSAADVNKVRDFIQNKFFGKDIKIKYAPEIRSELLLGIAKIIFDLNRDDNEEKINKKKIPIKVLKAYMGRYARYAADAFVDKFANIDSIRFLYIQALKNLRDNGNISFSISMLIATFFVKDSNKLSEELVKYGLGNSDYYYKENCVSIKDLLIATFMLEEKQNVVEKILRNLFNEVEKRKQINKALYKMTEQEKKNDSFYAFKDLWVLAQRRYSRVFQQLGKEIADSVNEFQMSERTRQHIQSIKLLMSAEMLWNQDERILTSYVRILSMIENTYEKYSVKEKINGFRNIEDSIDELESEIMNSPTEFSFDHVYTRLTDLKAAIRSAFDELYQSSIPELEITLSNDSVYVNDNTVKIAIAFKNADNKQDADAVRVELEASAGAYFPQREKTVTSVRSGDVQEYIAAFSLTDRVINEGQFEVKVRIQYSYQENVECIKNISISKVLPITIIDRKDFTKIDNKYKSIIRGNGIDLQKPELFKGRNELINSICASMTTSNGIMTKNRGIILWGQKRVGKNSVKDYLKEKIRKTYPDAYIIIELGSIGDSRNLKEVLANIINNTENALISEHYELYEQLIQCGVVFDGEALENKENYMSYFTNFMVRFSTQLRKISLPEKNIPLYFIDEFSYLYEWIEKGELNGIQFMRFWKSFITRYGICSIIIAQDNIPVWKAMYANEFDCMDHDNEITYLDFNGAKELICEPCKINNKDLFTPDAVKLIYDWTKGSAFLIVIFCKHIIDYLNDNYMEKATKTIVQIVFEKEFIDKKGLFFEEDFDPQLSDVANVKDAKEIYDLNKELLKEIARQTVSSARVKKDALKFFMKYEKEKAEKIFRRLKERKIIEADGDSYCMISLPLLKFYLLREQSEYEVLSKLTR